MTAPSPPIPSFTDGNVVHQGDLNALSANFNNLYSYLMGGFRNQAPMALIGQNNAQTVVPLTYTLLNLDTPVINNNNMWVASQANQLTVQTAGTYLLISRVGWANSFSGYRFNGIMVNGTAVPTNYITNATYFDTGQVSGAACVSAVIYPLAVGATLFVLMAQGSGANQPTATGQQLNAYFAAWRIGP